MIKNIFLLPSVWLLFSFGDCSKKTSGAALPFDSSPVAVLLSVPVREASGIAASKVNSGYLWAEEDSGNPPQLYLLKTDGAVLKKVYINGAANRDWEDLVLAGTDLYIGDIGDNNAAFSEYTIYQFPEPSLGVDTVQQFNRIRFAYPDGAHDAEAFLIDVATKDIYLITKRDAVSRIYKLAYPYSLTSVNTATLVGSLPYTGAVSATLSPDGREIIVKTYTGLYHYSRSSGETIVQALQKSFTNLPYVLELQGEAVGFAADNSGFYTLGEMGSSSTAILYFYKRK